MSRQGCVAALPVSPPPYPVALHAVQVDGGLIGASIVTGSGWLRVGRRFV